MIGVPQLLNKLTAVSVWMRGKEHLLLLLRILAFTLTSY